MHIPRVFRFPWRSRRHIRADVDAELDFHLEMRARELEAAGLSPQAALDEARRRFGDLDQTKRYCRSQDVALERSLRRGEVLNDLLLDVRYAGRTLRRSPAFTAVAVLTLALGVGANTAIFSAVNGVLLKPLPYGAPDGIVRIFSRHPGGRMPVSPLDVSDWRKEAKSLRAMSATTEGPTTITGDRADAERVMRASVSTNLLEVIGVQPVVGQPFTPGHDNDGEAARREALVSEALWERRFGRDPAIVGKTILLDNVAHEIRGVIPRGKGYPTDADVWTPIRLTPELFEQQTRIARFQRVVARLAPGVSVQQAQTEMNQIASRLAKAYPDANANVTAEVIGLTDLMVGDLRRPLFILLGAVGFVMLIGCANVANLLLVRAALREAEIAVRRAIGASRGRIVRQLVTESMLLSLAGGAAGLALAAWGTRRLAGMAQERLPRLDTISVDGTVLAVSLAISVITGLLFGLVPAWAGARTDLARALGAGARGSITRGGRMLQRTLVISELGLSLVLLAGAAVLIRGFTKLRQIEPGFRVENLVTFDLSMRQRRGSPDQLVTQRRETAREIVRQLSELQGVERVVVVAGLPMSGASLALPLELEGHHTEPGQQLAAQIRPASAGYLELMGIPLRTGRSLTNEDRVGAPNTVVISEMAARQFFPGGEAIGKRLYLLSDTTWRTIVGVVGDVREFGLAEDPWPQIYLPIDQAPMGDVNVVMLTRERAEALEPRVRATLKHIDPEMPMRHLTPLGDLVAGSVSQPRFYMVLLSLFATLALALAAVGIYGVISYAVSRRTREIGVRMALGASVRDISALVLRDGVLLTVVGLALGAVGALWATRLLRGVIQGMSATDPIAFVSGILVLGAVALVACWIPARRASKVDPAIAMRTE